MATKNPKPAKTSAATPSRSQPKIAKAATPAKSSSPGELSDDMWEQIAKKAYELWEQRGRREGQDMQNWLDAEAIVMDETHEARE
ncbi:MAG: DUF2934 domain-containing protein [Nitrospira sp.]|nr:DUF2934 domain-containing protein [Nitrospira sp.]